MMGRMTAGLDMRGPRRQHVGARTFAWSVWVALLAVALWYVARFGADAPRWDDYAVTPQLCGRAPITASWLWSQHSEHRIPIARLVLLGVFKLDGADPRPVMALVVAALATGAAALLIAAGRAPGGARYSDAFLPVVLLHLGHHENLLWAIQFTYALPVALLCGVAAAVSSPGRPSPARAAAAGACLLVMPLCNAGGLLLLPIPIAWLTAMAAAEWRSGSRGRAAWDLLCASPAVLLAAFYLWGYRPSPHHAPPGNAAAVLRSTLQFLATGLGTAGVDLWPWSGIAAAALALGATVVLLAAWLRLPGDRPRIEGLLSLLASAGLLALATGWGRSGEGPTAGLQPRYATLAAPIPALAYLAFAFYGGRRLRPAATTALLLAGLALLWPNARDALYVGRIAAERATAFDRDRDAGVPIFRLANRHAPFLHPSQQALHGYLEMLREAGLGPFARMQPDPAFREIPVDLRPADVRLALWRDGEIKAIGPDPWVRFDLPAPIRVAGVRIRYDHRNDDGAPARFRLAWRPDDRYRAPERQYGDWNLPTGDDRSVTVWIDGPVAQVRVQPDNRRCRFRIRELTLLVEPTTAGTATREHGAAGDLPLAREGKIAFGRHP